MRNKHITIGDEKFELIHHSSHTTLKYKEEYINGCRSIYDCYKKPSFYKYFIWYHIVKFAENNDCIDIRVLSHNSQFFTVGMTKIINNKVYLLVITPKHRYAFEVFYD